MKLSEEQFGAAVDLLKCRLRDRGGPVEARARELCARELKGWISVKELLGGYVPDSAPHRWVDGDHERELDYHDPLTLADKAAAVAADWTRGDADDLDTLQVEREVIARILRRLEAGGGLLRRKVRWVTRYHTLQPGEKAVVRKGLGQVQCGHQREEWCGRAVLIMSGEKVVKVFPEARQKRMNRFGKGTSKKPVLEMLLPELDVPELSLRRIGMNVAVLLRRLRRIDGELRSAAAIARAAGVTRANVSARQIKMEAEEEADRPAKFKARRPLKKVS